MNEEQLMEKAEFLRDQQREDGLVFTGRWVSSCCRELMDYNQGRCPSCMECCEPEAEMDGLETTPEELLQVLNKAQAEMKEKGLT